MQFRKRELEEVLAKIDVIVDSDEERTMEDASFHEEIPSATPPQLNVDSDLSFILLGCKFGWTL